MTGPRSTGDAGVDPDALERARAALDESTRVDADRVRLLVEGNRVVLRGSVATAEESDVAAIIAESELPEVVNALTVDQGLREGDPPPTPAEAAVPVDDEFLLDDPDPLAGPDAEFTDDMATALEENEPLEASGYDDEPHLAPTAAEEYGGAAVPLGGFDPELADEALDPDDTDEFGDEAAARVGAGGGVGGDLDPDDVGGDTGVVPAAADLSAEDLREAAHGHPVPALDPDAVAASDSNTPPDPSGREELGDAPSEAVAADHYPSLVPGTEAGGGAMGEGTVGGGGLGGEPAAETGATGADTAAADPTRERSGGTTSDLGTEPGPSTADDPALREDVPRGG